MLPSGEHSETQCNFMVAVCCALKVDKVYYGSSNFSFLTNIMCNSLEMQYTPLCSLCTCCSVHNMK